MTNIIDIDYYKKGYGIVDVEPASDLDKAKSAIFLIREVLEDYDMFDGHLSEEKIKFLSNLYEEWSYLGNDLH